MEKWGWGRSNGSLMLVIYIIDAARLVKSQITPSVQYILGLSKSDDELQQTIRHPYGSFPDELTSVCCTTSAP